MCNECEKECVGVTPCGNCAVLIEEREKQLSGWDVLAFVSIVVVAYLWAIAGQGR